MDAKRNASIQEDPFELVGSVLRPRAGAHRVRREFARISAKVDKGKNLYEKHSA
jgi:hypothetical protein